MLCPKETPPLMFFVFYCCDDSSLSFSCFNEIELIQYLKFVGFGPSSNTCPKCAPHLLQFTSVRVIPYDVSEIYSIFSSLTGFQKLGHPEPESNFASDRNNSSPQHEHLYAPSSLLLLYLPENGGSVPWLIQTSYWFGLSSFFHSSGVFTIFFYHDLLYLFRY